jgi:hypothetical protein
MNMMNIINDPPSSIAGPVPNHSIPPMQYSLKTKSSGKKKKKKEKNNTITLP